MKTTDLRQCDACGTAIVAVVYDVRVQQQIVVDGGTELQPVGASLDLQLCLRCGCGLNTHALPLAIEHRSQALDKESRHEQR